MNSKRKILRNVLSFSSLIFAKKKESFLLQNKNEYFVYQKVDVDQN